MPPKPLNYCRSLRENKRPTDDTRHVRQTEDLWTVKCTGVMFCRMFVCAELVVIGVPNLENCVDGLLQGFSQEAPRLHLSAQTLLHELSSQRVGFQPKGTVRMEVVESI